MTSDTPPLRHRADDDLKTQETWENRETATFFPTSTEANGAPSALH